MNKLTKVGLTALGTALVSTSAIAADMAVAGGAKLTLSGGDKATTGNGWTITDSITFRASADLDNGWTVSTAQNLGKGAINNSNLKVNMGDIGTLEMHSAGGSSVPASWDDMMPTANEESWHGLTGAAAGTGPIMAAGANGDMFRYSVNVMDGVDLYASYSPSDGATAVESSSSYGLQYTGIEGLTVGYAQGNNSEKVAVTNGSATASAAGAEIDNTSMFVKYAIDSFTLGIQDNESDSATANADQAYRAYGVSYQITPDLSISYAVGTVDYELSSASDQETVGVGVSFTSGGITISGSMHDGEDLGGSTSTLNDKKAYELNIAFAF